jgi:hypothetical protein
MKMRKLLLATAAVASLAGLSSAAHARTDVGVYLNFAPPAVRYEPVPAVRVGYAWVPGYWDWRANRHYWVAGHYVRARPGYTYYPGRWAHVDGRYRYEAAYWHRDRDHDGIPDYRDHHVGYRR